MLHTTKAIILKTTKYSENSLVVQAYTKLFGIQSYLINNVHAKKSANKSAYFQAMSMVELVVYHNQKQSLQRIKEVRLDYAYQSAGTDFAKHSILLFLNEVIYKSIKEEEPNENLYEFLQQALQLLDHWEGSFPNFHLLFMIKLSVYLGFFPHGSYQEDTPYFNLVEGVYQWNSSGNHVLNKELSKLLFDVSKLTFEQVDTHEMKAVQRRELLDTLIEYYELHILNFRNIKSKDILQTMNS